MDTKEEAVKNDQAVTVKTRTWGTSGNASHCQDVSEIFTGLEAEQRKHLSKSFEIIDNNSGEVEEDIFSHSMCEHHCIYGKVPALPIFKWPRGWAFQTGSLRSKFALKPQIQERLLKSQMPWWNILEHKEPCLGRSQRHMCMNMRGVRKPWDHYGTTAAWTARQIRL